ncbi:MAG: TIR domain-containing protein [Candidatus Thiodiazotropha sp.]
MDREQDYQLFVSYTRTPDAKLARELERFLESFHTVQPLGDPMPLTPLRVCVDGSDFSMPPMAEREGRVRQVLDVVYTHLARSRELLVLCSEEAVDSRWVAQEISWFIEHYGSGRVRLAFTEGEAPWKEPARYFPRPLLDQGLDKSIAYDLRGYDRRRSSQWHQVPDFSREMVRLAADLHGRSAGDLYPTWLEAELERARRQSATMASNARFETFSGDPARAVLAAYQAYQLHPDDASEAAMRDAYRVAVMHHHNRRQISQITGSGPSYLAGRWKQGDVFTKNSRDGRFRLLVTERGRDGPHPPGEVFLLNNETTRVVKLLPSKRPNYRVEESAFDRSIERVFVTRYFDLYVYDMDGSLIDTYTFSRFTKSPVHLVDGLFLGRWILGAETKGGVWLVDPEGGRDAVITVHPEFHGDATIFTDMSPDGSRISLVYESGKADLLELERDDQPRLRTLAEQGCLYAGFPTGRSDQVVTAGERGILSILDIRPKTIRKRLVTEPLGSDVDWVSWDADTQRFALVGGDRQIHIADAETGMTVATLDYRDQLDWRDAMAIQAPHTYVDPAGAWTPGEGVPFTNDELAVSALERHGDQTWVVTETWPNEYWPAHQVHLVENGRAFFLADGDVPITDRYDMLKLGGSQRSFARVSGFLRAFPPEGLVHTMLMTNGDLWVGTRSGAYRRDDNRFERMTPPGVDVHDLVEIDGVVWIYGSTGAYAFDGRRLLRVTDPFLHVSTVQKVGQHIWMLGKPGSTAFGPAWRVDGWLATAVPDRHTPIKQLFETPDAVWLAGETGLFRVRGDEVVAQELELAIHTLQQVGGTIWCTTQCKSLLGGASPLLRIDADTMEVQEFNLGVPVLIPVGDAVYITHGGMQAWPLNDTPTGVRRLSRLDERSPRPIELGDADVRRVTEHLGTPWVLTSRGAFTLDGERAVAVSAPQLSYSDVTLLQGSSWLLAKTGAVRLRGGHATVFDTEYPVRKVIRVCDATWLLTSTDDRAAGPAYRVQGSECFRHDPGDGLGVASVVDYGNESWFLTRRGQRAGPMIRSVQ